MNLTKKRLPVLRREAESDWLSRAGSTQHERAEVHREGEVLAEVVGDDAMELTARLDEAAAAKLAKWIAM